LQQIDISDIIVLMKMPWFSRGGLESGPLPLITTTRDENAMRTLSSWVDVPPSADGVSTGRSTHKVLQTFGLLPSQFEGKKFLDIGCGLSKIYADLVRVDFPPAYGAVVDSHPSALEYQRKYNKGVDVRNASATKLPFADGEFDVVISNYSVPCWAQGPEEVRSAFEEATRVLGNGGILAVNPMDCFTTSGDTSLKAMVREELSNQERVFNNPDAWDRVHLPHRQGALLAQRRPLQ